MAQLKRQYDIVLLGATGYTGKLVAEYISKALPTNTSWAIAGRSQQKLDSIASDLSKRYPDRKEPGNNIEFSHNHEVELTDYRSCGSCSAKG